ncbi:MAG: acyltransferase [Alphaproteobacteria bacterium]|nr:acyltransferase [Alphaproteobacteria bacterium]
MTFRTDINGLRAIAVLSVLIHHFGVSGFSGGYVGVDVFFVISGYLMTKIICTKLSEGQFSMIGFYAARARRILPAMAGLTAFLLTIGYFYLVSIDYKFLGKTSLSALTFYSNFVFVNKGDYFDDSSMEKWLLHTWSLSVEWQFYILLPLFLMGLYKFKGGKFLKQGVVNVLILSMWANLVMAKNCPIADFFMSHSRIWEFLAGGLIFFYAPTLSKIPHLGKAGLLFILTSVFFFPAGDIAYPGYWAILPVAGTAFVIAAQKRNILLDNKVMQFFGDISYSLYLWHWPIIVGAIYFGVPLTLLNVLILISVSILLAKTSYVFIETPFRHPKKGKSHRTLLLTGFGGYLFIALMSFLVYFFKGLPTRLPADVRAIELEAKNAKSNLWRYDCNRDCSYKKGDTLPEYVIGAPKVAPSAAIWGDSHAGALSISMNASLTEAGRSSFIFNHSCCPPILETVYVEQFKRCLCKHLNQITYDKIISNPNIKDVFMIGRWSVYLQGYNEKGKPHPYVVFGDKEKANRSNLEERSKRYTQKMVETACALTSHGKNVYMMSPIPEIGRKVPTIMAKSRLLYQRNATVDIPLSVHIQRHAPVIAALERATKECGVHLLNPIPLLCDATTCSGVRNGKSLYVDDDHLNARGGRIVKPLFDEALQQR